MMSRSLLILPKGHSVQEGTGDISYKGSKGSGKTVAYWYEETALSTNISQPSLKKLQTSELIK